MFVIFLPLNHYVNIYHAVHVLFMAMNLYVFCRIKSFDFWLNARRRHLGQFGGDKVILS